MRPQPPFSLMQRRALLGLCLAGLALRLALGWHAAWYWDEGYLAELALDLGRGLRPHSGALWHDGFFPLSTSWLAPLSAAPFTRLPGLDALHAVRLWAALLGSLSVWVLAEATRRLLGAGPALLAALLLALAPPALRLGSLGLYHPLGILLGLLALERTLRLEEEGRGPAWPAGLLAGLALAACYWLWWLPLSLFLFVRAPRRLGFAGAAVLPPLAVLGLQLGLGGPDAWLNAKALLAYPGQAFRGAALAQDAASLPWLVLGLLGLFSLPGRGRWLALGPWLGWLDVLRQRSGFSGSPYLFLPLLPWLSLGLAALAWRLRGSGRGGLALALLACLSAWPGPDLDWIRRLSAEPLWARNLQAFLKARARPDDIVCGLPNINWRLRSVCVPVEPAQVAAAEGQAAGLLPAGLSPAAFAVPCRLEQLRYFVVAPAHYDTLFLHPALAAQARRLEQEGWPEVFQSPAYRVFANPRLEGRRQAGLRVLPPHWPSPDSVGPASSPGP